MLRSEITPLLIAHISGGALAVLFGVIALSVRKGSPIHRAAGSVFVAAMLVGASSAAWLGYNAEPQDIGDVIAGSITIYFVTTAWVSAKRKDNEIGLFEKIAFAFAAIGGAGALASTWMAVADGTAFMGGIPGFIFASVALLAAALDLSVILRRGLPERQRIARHLWRMLIGFFVAAGSFFPGQLHLFPEYVRDIRPVIILFIPAFSIIAIMFFWLFRVLLTRWGRAPGVTTLN